MAPDASSNSPSEPAHQATGDGLSGASSSFLPPNPVSGGVLLPGESDPAEKRARFIPVVGTS